MTNGNPPGFTTTYDKGWASVPIAVNSSASAGMWGRFHDADSAGAVSRPNTGTILQVAVPLATTLAVGPQTINVIVPAGPKFYYLDLALDAAMTNPLRVGPFGVGHVTFATGQSLVEGNFEPYAYYSNGIPDGTIAALTTIFPQNVVYGPYNTHYAGGRDILAVGSDVWETPVDTYAGPYCTTWAPEYLSKITAKLGVVAALTGFAHNGASIVYWDADDPNSDYNLKVLPVLAHVGQFDTLIWGQGGSDYNTMTVGEYASRLADVVDAFRAQTGRDFLLVTGNEDIGPHFADNTRGATAMEISHQRIAAMYPNARWNGYADSMYSYVGHPTMIGRMHSARNYYRVLLDQLGLGGAGPALTGVARRAAGSRVINLPVQHSTGTNLTGYAHVESSVTGFTETFSPSSVSLGKLFSVFPPGSADPAARVALDSARPVILHASSIDLVLAAAPTTPLDIWYYTDVGEPGADGAVQIRDNAVDGDGIPYGRMMIRRTTPIYLAANPLPATSIAITSINGLGSGSTVPTSAVTIARGTWAGMLPKSIVIHIGSEYRPITATNIYTNGTWAVSFTSPTPVGTYSVAARRDGVLDSAMFSITAAASDFPISGATFDVDPRRISLFCSDKAHATPVAGAGRIGSMVDPTGAGNHLTIVSRRPKLGMDMIGGLPALQFTNSAVDTRYSDISGYVTALMTVSGAPLPAGLRDSSYTIMYVMKPLAGGGAVFTAEIPWVYGHRNTQALLVGIGTGALARRHNASVSSSVDDRVASTRKLRKVLVRFDVTTGTLKLKASDSIEQTVTAAGDYMTGEAWTKCLIGVSGAFDSGGSLPFNGLISRIVAVPGHYATDTERDAILAYADRLYGS